MRPQPPAMLPLPARWEHAPACTEFTARIVPGLLPSPLCLPRTLIAFRSCQELNTLLSTISASSFRFHSEGMMLLAGRVRPRPTLRRLLTAVVAHGLGRSQRSARSNPLSKPATASTVRISQNVMIK